MLHTLQLCSDGCYNVWQANCTTLVQKGWCGTHSVCALLYLTRVLSMPTLVDPANVLITLPAALHLQPAAVHGPLLSPGLWVVHK
jgi:hypothetical protein